MTIAQMNFKEVAGEIRFKNRISLGLIFGTRQTLQVYQEISTGRILLNLWCSRFRTLARR